MRKVTAVEGTKAPNERELQDARKRSGVRNNRMMAGLGWIRGTDLASGGDMNLAISCVNEGRDGSLYLCLAGYQMNVQV